MGESNKTAAAAAGPEPGEQAEVLFAEWAAQAEDGGAEGIEPLLAAHPVLAEELHRLHTDWMLYAPVLQRLVPGSITLDEPVGAGLEDDQLSESDHEATRLGLQIPDGRRYRFRGVLGRGGGGAVLKVWDSQLNRPLAMKIVLGADESVPTAGAAPVDGRTLARFVDEARIASQLTHPGIVPVHEVGTDDAGRVFFTMKLVKGDHLSEVLSKMREDRDGWDQIRVLGVLHRVCEAMAYAHQRGVIHRDLKPANVMVGPFGETYVMDWGLARAEGRSARDGRAVATAGKTVIDSLRAAERGADPASPLITGSGAILGTPIYMAPEQARGEVERMGPVCDVYSVGAMLYELLCGRPPYVPPGATLSPHTVLMAVVDGPPTPVEQIVPRAPVELVAICEKAMARNMEDRYPSMQELASDVRAFLDRKVVKAYESGAWAETRKWVQRNKALAASTVVALLSLGVGSALVTDYAAESAERKWMLRRLNLTSDLNKRLERFESLDEADSAAAGWIEEARALVTGTLELDESDPHWRPGANFVEANLAELRTRAISRTEAEILLDRQSHPLWHDYESNRQRLRWMSRMLGLEPWPREEPMEAYLEAAIMELTAAGRLPAWMDANTDSRDELISMVLHLVRPSTWSPGSEGIARVLALRAVGRSSSEASEAVRRALGHVDLNAPPSPQGWSPEMACGRPDAPKDEDSVKAWAYESRQGQHWLEVAFPGPLHATSVRIHEVNAAGGVVKVEVIEDEGRERVLWEGDDPTQAPGVFEREVSPFDPPMVGLRLHLDADRNRDTWCEIDAVEAVVDGGSQWASTARACCYYGSGDYPLLGVLAWVFFRVGQLDDAASCAAQVRTMGLSEHFESWQEDSLVLEDQLDAWSEAHVPERRAERDALAAEVEQLERRIDAVRRTWTFADGADQWWHKLLVDSRSSLEQLRWRLAGVEERIGGVWREAIEEIARSGRYRATAWPNGRLTPQLGLVPLGPDPDSGLWEFAHLGSGVPAERQPDGTLRLGPETGLVLVLLPGGRVPLVDHPKDEDHADTQDPMITRVDLAPFFLSKYEMTEGQRERLERGGAIDHIDHEDYGLFPVSEISWEECDILLEQAGRLSLPTEAQWEYGCRAGSRSTWWFGNDRAGLADVASTVVQPIGRLRANAFGLHDVHGNVGEWCLDQAQGAVMRRAGDGLSIIRVTDRGDQRRIIRGEWNTRFPTDCSTSTPALGSAYPPGIGLRPARSLSP